MKILGLLMILVLLFGGARDVMGQSCVDPKQFYGHVLKVNSVSDDSTAKRWQGSGWLYRSNRLLVTNEHVVNYLGLSEDTSRPLMLMQKTSLGAESHQIFQVTGIVLAKSAQHDIALVWLSAPLQQVPVLTDISPVLKQFQTLSVVGYAGHRLQFGRAWVHVQLQINGSSGGLSSDSFLPLDVETEESLDAFATGVSGSPLFNCNGQVAGVVWGNRSVPATGKPIPSVSPNVYATSIQVVEELYQQIQKVVR
ncbi:serine protease [Patescibacteria group bacterium]|nr:serine protease [Patescibacteria group bacterium]